MSTTLAVTEVARRESEAPESAVVGHRSHFDAIDLNLRKAIGCRFALAIELSAYGAREASAERGGLIREGEIHIAYSDAATPTEAADEYAGWGLIRELAPLFNASNAGEKAKAADAFCSGCWYPASEVGVLTDYVVHAKSGDVKVRYCDECAAAHASTQRAVAQVRAARASHLFDVSRVIGLFGAGR